MRRGIRRRRAVPPRWVGWTPRLVPSLVVVAVVWAFTASPASAQVRVRTEVDTTLLSVGDRVTLTVRVEHGADQSVLWPDSLALDPFEVLGARTLPMELDGDRGVSGAEFTLTAFELGALEIPSFTVEVLSPDGSVEGAETDAFAVEVASVGTDDGGDIREIRGPLAIPVSVIRVAAWSLLLLLLGAALMAALHRWRSRRRPVPEAPAGPPPPPPHVVALEALDGLAASPLLERGEIKEYHIRVSDILRRYVEARFGVPALEMTTWEVVQGLERAGADGDLRDRLRRFLDRCDLVKFAKVRPDEGASRETLEMGRGIVESTIPAEAGASATAGSEVD